MDALPLWSPSMLAVFLMSKVVHTNIEVYGAAVMDYVRGPNGYSYRLYKTNMTWEQAYLKCEADGGHLSTVDTESEWKEIKQIFKEDFANPRWNRIWVGVQDKVIEGRWQTVYETPFVNGRGVSWAPGEPTNMADGPSGREENCACIQLDKKMLGARDCLLRQWFLCTVP